MKRFLLTIPTFVTLVLLQSSLYSQVVFHVETDTLISPNPASLNDSLYFRFVVSNQGNIPFTDSLYIVRQVNGFVDTIDIIQNVSLDTVPGDTQHISTGEIATANRYGGGINVVVIWPTGPATPPTLTDSLIDSVEVLGTASLPEPYRGALFQVYPNPSANLLRFVTDIPGNAIEQVQLLGINGQAIRSYTHLPSTLSLADLAKGTYLIQVVFKGGVHRTLKVVRN